MLLFQFKIKKIESLSYRKKPLNSQISWHSSRVCILDALIYESCLTLILLLVLLCALHEFNYNLKVVNVVIVI